MPISQWPSTERPHEKLIANGAKNLSDAELLAIFIHNGAKGKTALDIACSLIKHFGGIRKILDSTPEEIYRFSGIGKIKYSKLIATLEISYRYLKEQLTNTNIIYNAETAYLYLTGKLRPYEREVFACLFLNAQNRVIHYEEIFYGTINNTSVYPREIAKIALRHNAAAVIFAHNHPSGTLDPSPQDKDLTSALIKILQPLDIKVLDHIIIGCNGYTSLIETFG